MVYQQFLCPPPAPQLPVHKHCQIGLSEMRLGSSLSLQKSVD